MNNRCLLLLGLTSMILFACSPQESAPTHPMWHTITLNFEGPETDEQAEDNPFTDYRLTVLFQNGDHTYSIPGFYAADGKAAETSASSGNVWQVRFSPDKVGAWTYEASFRKGEMIAISDDPKAGTEVPLKNATGAFTVAEASNISNPRDFRNHGRIVKHGKYFQHVGSKNYFLKGGADSPENFLAYADFDGTQRPAEFQARKGESAPDEGLHRYEAHLKDWQEGDLTWQGEKGKTMVGALNYLVDQGMNSVYFLTLNIKGDGEDVWPYTSYEERQRFDCSKLDQWELIFSDMEQKGIMMHVVTQETENERLLDDGDVGPMRQLYYRELIARFGHHLALIWNLGEENGPADFSPDGQTYEQQKAMATYFEEHDPYGHPVVIHTHAWEGAKDHILDELLGHKDLDGLAMQISDRTKVYGEIRKWHEKAEEAGHGWLIGMDEIGMWHTGVMPDDINPDHDTIRQEVLWGSLMAGAAGVEWYFGARYAHNDLGMEDWRSRQNMWDQTRYAMEIFGKIPYWEMEPQDDLLSPEGAWSFSKPGEVYLCYFPFNSEFPFQLNLPDSPSNYQMTWHNPRTGESHDAGSPSSSIGSPPNTPEKDWVLLIQRK